ncbi:MAG: phage Gp37/Gp68 family protein [Bacteroidetes bacterium]|nr:phage Gp37/Gp68 family protein [Bacteroidota bacterium]MBP6402763.1 phage Gp37/Gp68 family protein [Bacteroidia bacterium]MBP6648641.1 phage Gp37/Gp68 family protein [Bacteroidia bacterium]
MAQSNIEWTEMTWNPTTGCTKVSAGCKFCYAEVMSKRLHAMGLPKYKNSFSLALHPETLDTPYSWNKPKKVFVNSMSDLFHKNVPLSFIKKVFRVMNENQQHTFQVLTKRPELVLKYDEELNWTPNIWMGTSVENEKVVDRIDSLRNTHARIKFLSLEPLIGPLPNLNLNNIHWVIVGGESGHHARPMKKEWVMDIKKQCEASEVFFFFKQWGKPAFNSDPEDPTIDKNHPQHAKGGCTLDGMIIRKMPV